MYSIESVLSACLFSWRVYLWKRAPLRSSSCTTLVWPSLEAKWSGVRPRSSPSLSRRESVMVSSSRWHVLMRPYLEQERERWVQAVGCGGCFFSPLWSVDLWNWNAFCARPTALQSQRSGAERAQSVLATEHLAHLGSLLQGLNL